MPEWMQIRVQKPPKNKDVEQYMHPTQKPIRSVFSFMHTSHNVHSKELAAKAAEKLNSNEIYRIYQWNEDVSKQRFDSCKITPKIGTPY